MFLSYSKALEYLDRAVQEKGFVHGASGRMTLAGKPHCIVGHVLEYMRQDGWAISPPDQLGEEVVAVAFALSFYNIECSDRTVFLLRCAQAWNDHGVPWGAVVTFAKEAAARNYPTDDVRDVAATLPVAEMVAMAEQYANSFKDKVPEYFI